jgi:hypothetical protein
MSTDVRKTTSEDSTILLDVKQALLFSMNCVGTRVWELLEAGLPEAEIVSRISQSFDAEHGIIEQDVHRFIESLKKHGLVVAY